jgi:hypothetical protein
MKEKERGYGLFGKVRQTGPKPLYFNHHLFKGG